MTKLKAAISEPSEKRRYPAISFINETVAILKLRNFLKPLIDKGVWRS